MAATSYKPELIVIVGPTASGKSELAIKIAQKYSGEIISADSRTLYKGMNIGTAKPKLDDQKSVRHWGLDLINPDQKFSAKQFKDYALAAAADIRSRSKLPIIVGGTSLYINSVIFDYKFEVNEDKDPINSRHSARKPSENTIIENTLLIGLDPGKEELAARIKKRAQKIVGPDFVAEVKAIIKEYGQNLEAYTATSYRPMRMYLTGEIDLGEVKKMFVQNDLKLAKKQRTWFKRNKFILWQNDIESALQTVDKLLNT